MKLDEETLSLLRRITTATITMQLLKRGIRNSYIRGSRPLDPAFNRVDGPRMVGEAFTVRFIPMREDLATPAALGARDNPSRVAIDTVPQGAVLVIDGRGLADIAVFGDILAARVQQRGAAGRAEGHT